MYKSTGCNLFHLFRGVGNGSFFLYFYIRSNNMNEFNKKSDGLVTAIYNIMSFFVFSNRSRHKI